MEHLWLRKKKTFRGSEEILQRLKCSVNLCETSSVTGQCQAKLVCD